MKQKVDSMFLQSIKFALSIIVLWTNSYLSSNITINTQEQIPQYNSPMAQGFLNRLTFAIPQQGSNGTGTNFIPFSICPTPTVPQNDQCNAIVLQPDGCILLTGITTDINNVTYFAVARYLPNGELDPTFGQIATPRAGTQYIPFTIAGGTNDTATAIGIQSDGKIIVAGNTSNLGGSTYLAVARFTPTGQLDTTFGQTGLKAGTQYIPFSIIGGGNLDEAGSITIQKDDKIIFAGTTYTAGNTSSSFAIARFTAQGLLDTSFGQAGVKSGTQYIAPIYPGGNNFDSGITLTLQPDDKIIMAGTTQDIVPNTYFALARFTTTGQLDTTFGGGTTGARGGTQYLSPTIAGGESDSLSSIALQNDGKIVLSGFSYEHTNTTTFFSLARFTSNGQLDTTFGGFTGSRPGTQYVPFTIIPGGVGDTRTTITIQSDSKILLSGYSLKNGPLTAFISLARFLSNGQLDTATFGNIGSTQAGTSYIPFSISGQTTPNIYDTNSGIKLQSGTNAIVGGTSSNANNPPFYFAVASVTY